MALKRILRFDAFRSPGVRFTPDCVAKLFAALRKSNYRIRLNRVLNRCCAPVLVLESILLNLVVKIVLQHGVIPGSCHTKAQESALQERMRPSSCGLATMESCDATLCRT